ncbi:MAG: hypothetical protein P1U68_10400 [Verrucomicrobiales bacterium]|nr:hypothetical protein [Verrucomicrobiales bacterium]
MNRIFAHQREKHGLKRKTGARRMKGPAWEGLHVMRDLTVDRIG